MITLLTDFGLQDTYVAEVKAVLLQAKQPIVDLCHEIAPFDVRWGAFQLLRAYRYFPKKTIHLAVVDPGVGSPRDCVYVRTKDYVFIGPDNGVLRWAVEDCDANPKIYRLPKPEGLLPTFHARDLMAPFTVGLIKNKIPRLEKKSGLEGAPFPKAVYSEKTWTGEILGWDRFGTLITSIPTRNVQATHALLKELRINAASYYAEIDRLGLLRGSHGFYEIAANQASAYKILTPRRGEKVILYASQ